MAYYQKILMLLAFVLLVSGSACSAQSSGSNSDKDCEKSISSMQGLPDLVLVGTDVVKITTLDSSSPILKCSYSAEMGGATLTLDINQTIKSKSIKRTFHEPGAKEQVRRYSPFCMANGFLNAQDLMGKIVKGGLLLYEKNPGVEGIPNDLWVFYKAN